MRPSRPDLGCCATEKNLINVARVIKSRKFIRTKSVTRIEENTIENKSSQIP
jgi:hypothetical protein